MQASGKQVSALFCHLHRYMFYYQAHKTEVSDMKLATRKLASTSWLTFASLLHQNSMGLARLWQLPVSPTFFQVNLEALTNWLSSSASRYIQDITRQKGNFVSILLTIFVHCSVVHRPDSCVLLCRAHT